MAGNDNTLGAPAEGFGQKVTFAVSADNKVPVLQRPDAVQARAGYAGRAATSTSSAQQVPTRAPDETLSALMKIGGALIAPKIKEMQTEQYIVGMQKAMQGEAIADIAETQPWYAKVFGNADAVEGARAYNAQAGVANAISSLEDEMPKLREMDADSAQQFFAKRVTGSLTGDKPTDLVIMNSLNKTLPALMKRQAKEHYGWRQEQANTAQSRSVGALADLLQKSGQGTVPGPDGQAYVTPEEFASQRLNFVQSFRPAAGQDIEAWQTARTKDLVGMATRGNFHAITALMEGVEDPANPGTRIGINALLKPEQVLAVEKAVEQGENKMRARADGDYAPAIALIRERARTGENDATKQQLFAEIKRINAEYAAKTGSTKPFIPASEQTSTLETLGVTIYQSRKEAMKASEAAGKAARTELEKQEAEIRTVTQTSGALLAGTYPDTITSEDNIAKGWDLIRNTMPDKLLDTQVQVYQNNGKVDRKFKERLEGMIRTAAETGNPDAIEAAYGSWAAIQAKSDSAADAYAGNQDIRMRAYHDLRGGNPAMAVFAFQQAFAGDLKLSKVSKEDQKVAVGALKGHLQSRMPEFMDGQIDLPDAELNKLAGLLSKDIERRLPYAANAGSAATQAYEAWRRNGGEVVGGFAVQNHKGNKDLSSILTDGGVPADWQGRAFRAAVGEKLKAAGLPPGEWFKDRRVHIMRADSGDSMRANYVIYVDDDGEMKTTEVNSGDIADWYKADKARRDTPVKLHAGAPITYTPENVSAGQRALAADVERRKATGYKRQPMFKKE